MKVPGIVDMDDEPVDKLIEAINLSHNTMKHISTLVTASIVAIATLLKTVFSNPDVLWLGFFSIVSLIVATICAVYTMSGLVYFRGLMAAHDANDVMEREAQINERLRAVFGYWIVFFAQLVCLGSFVFGLFLFACFAVVNLWP